jgi:hypothetical protein
LYVLPVLFALVVGAIPVRATPSVELAFVGSTHLKHDDEAVFRYRISEYIFVMGCSRENSDNVAGNEVSKVFDLNFGHIDVGLVARPNDGLESVWFVERLAGVLQTGQFHLIASYVFFGRDKFEVTGRRIAAIASDRPYIIGNDHASLVFFRRYFEPTGNDERPLDCGESLSCSGRGVGKALLISRIKTGNDYCKSADYCGGLEAKDLRLIPAALSAAIGAVLIGCAYYLLSKTIYRKDYLFYVGVLGGFVPFGAGFILVFLCFLPQSLPVCGFAIKPLWHVSSV